MITKKVITKKGDTYQDSHNTICTPLYKDHIAQDLFPMS